MVDPSFSIYLCRYCVVEISVHEFEKEVNRDFGYPEIRGDGVNCERLGYGSW